MGGMKFELSQDENSIIYTVQGQQNSTMTKTIIQTVNGATISGNVYGGGNNADVTGGTNITVGKEEGEQQQQGGGSGAPRRNQEPAQSDEPQQPQQPQNAATQSDQTRNATLTRQ